MAKRSLPSYKDLSASPPKENGQTALIELSPLPELTGLREVQKQVLLIFLAPKGKQTRLDSPTYSALAARGLIIPLVEQLIDRLLLEGKIKVEPSATGAVVELL